MKEHIIKSFAVICITAAGYTVVNAATATSESTIVLPKPATQATSLPGSGQYLEIPSATLLVDYPKQYLNKNVKFKAKFNKFSSVGLDYPPAMRSSQAYIGILLERDNVAETVIPLSELKIFMKRSQAEKLTDIDAGDKIEIKGRVFSAALGDPWLDVNELIITESKTNQQK